MAIYSVVLVNREHQVELGETLPPSGASHREYRSTYLACLVLLLPRHRVRRPLLEAKY